MSTLGSLFDGSGGFPLAGALSGITPLWASEIEPYPIAVTTSRFPQMKHLGNVAEVDGRKIPPVDIITFGSPCQDMSVAGKRVGMKHRDKGDDATTRSGLFYEAIRIIREMREATNGRYPTFAIWENVPGAFSSNGGEDFRCVLEELAKICGGGCTIPRPANGKWRHAGEIVGDGFSIAWRVLDAQYWGVPQRRKRIYLVADFAGGRAGKILFERESVRGDSAQGREAREGAAYNAPGSAGRSDRVKCLNPWDCQSKRKNLQDGVYPTLPAMDCGGANNQAVIYEPVVYDCRGNGDGCTVPNLTGDHENRVTDYTAICVGNGQMHQTELGDKTGALNCMHDQQAQGRRCEGIVYPHVTGALCANSHPGSYTGQDAFNDMLPVVLVDKQPRKYIVRRLTPLECCRLQGFPDGWGMPKHKDAMDDCEAAYWEGVRRTYAEIAGKTYKPFATRAALVKWYNGLHTDSAEYKMWGNGVALPCAYNVVSGCAEELRRICHADAGRHGS